MKDREVMNMGKRKVAILTGEPVVTCIAEMTLVDDGLIEMLDFVAERRPECLPEDLEGQHGFTAEDVQYLWPYDPSYKQGGRVISQNELLVELAARNCYYSFGQKAGRKTNAEFIANTQQGEVKHSSVLYHAKMSFFIAGVSRRVSHELIRNYVGADRTEEGAPSQESTRYVEHGGMFVCPVAECGNPDEEGRFADAMQDAYDQYLFYIERKCQAWRETHGGEEPKGTDRKRIYEAASMYLPHSTVTSFIWTTNPVALEKLFRERANPAADAEFQRFAYKWLILCLTRWPNLFPNLRRELGHVSA